MSYYLSETNSFIVLEGSKLDRGDQCGLLRLRVDHGAEYILLHVMCSVTICYNCRSRYPSLIINKMVVAVDSELCKAGQVACKLCLQYLLIILTKL